MTMKTVFIGAGNMAEAIVSGIVKSGVVDAPDVCLTDISTERLDALEKKYAVQTSTDNAAAVRQAAVVVLSVKPQIFPSIWPEIREALNPNALVISIMAGITVSMIAGERPVRVIRVMPNTPSLVGLGAAGIAAGPFASDADLEIAKKLMGAVGVVAVVTEPELDAVTALSGSGPAYVFYLLEAMLEATEQMGLDAEISRALALATVSGAAKLMQESGEDAATLRSKVTSKGGTTEAALKTMEARGAKKSIIEGILAAQARSKELANG